MVYKHAVFLLLSAFMLSVVKLLLKGEVGVCALNSHGNYIVYRGISWNCVFEFLWEPCEGLVEKMIKNKICRQQKKHAYCPACKGLQ